MRCHIQWSLSGNYDRPIQVVITLNTHFYKKIINEEVNWNILFTLPEMSTDFVLITVRK